MAQRNKNKKKKVAFSLDGGPAVQASDADASSNWHKASKAMIKSAVEAGTLVEDKDTHFTKNGEYDHFFVW